MVGMDYRLILAIAIFATKNQNTWVFMGVFTIIIDVFNL